MTPPQVLVGVLELLFATAAFLAVIWMLVKARGIAIQRLGAVARRELHASAAGDIESVGSSRISDLVQRGIGVPTWGLGIFFAYLWLTFSLRRFASTRPWGESLRAFLLDRLSLAGVAAVDALPGLFTVVVIALLTRFVTRLVHLLFQAIEDGRITIPGIYAETAEPTRRLVTIGLWLFGVAVAYPYLPGSGSDAFKGVSVFAGLVVSLGSSGIVNQMMSGLTLTYSRALRTGDFVVVGEVESSVTQLGALAAKIRTAQNEDVTIPNAVVVSQIVTNYTRLADTDGVFVHTDVTIGYDTPWRQVHALLLLGAARTAGVRRSPAPFVRQAALEDPYVKYILLFCLERPADRLKTLAAVHANILDAFNEYGVQIMSPRYVLDPEAPKVVPRAGWFPPPAAAETEADAGVAREDGLSI